jgi:hypothetical protein
MDNIKSNPVLHHSLSQQLLQPSSQHSPLPSPEHSPQNFGSIRKNSRRRYHNKDNQQHHDDILGPGERKSIDIMQQQSYFDDNIRDHRENYTDLLVLPTNIELPMIDILNPNVSLLKNKIYNNNDYDKNDYKNNNHSQLLNTNSVESLSIISLTHHSSSIDDNHYSLFRQDHSNSYNSSRNNSLSNIYLTNNSINNKSYDISNHNDDSMMSNNNNNPLVTPMNKQQLHEIGKSSLHSKSRHRYTSRVKRDFYMDG